MSQDDVRRRREADAAQAWSLARAAREAGDPGAARFWFERVRRLAPDDPRPALELAMVLAGAGDGEAAAIFAGLAARWDLAAAWLGLAAMRHRAGDAQGAAGALASLLARHEPPDTPEFEALARAIAKRAGYSGWRGAADPAAIRRIEGIVRLDEKGLSGWAVRPAAPEAAPELMLTDAAGRRRAIRCDTVLEPAPEAPFRPRHGFHLPKRALARLTPPFAVARADGAALYGSPVHPLPAGPGPRPADFTGTPPDSVPEQRPLAVVVPAYRDAALTGAALDSLFAALPQGVPVIVVDDAGPEPALRALLADHARAGRVRLVRHRRNRGFPASANVGMRAARRLLGACDILLLNADTLMPPGAVARLHAALYARPEAGSVTPFSNEATILSYPKRGGGNPAPDLAGTIALDRLAKANRGALVEIPTAIGFCMAIRHDCLRATGLLREDVFGQGYGEENDWCMRARHRGWRHFADASCFVAHRGGASFGAAGRALAERNIGLLNRLHPGYDALIAAHAEADPLRGARRRLDLARFRAGRKKSAIALVSHDHGGGIARVVEARMAALRAEGMRPILLQPDFSDPASRETGIGLARLTDGAADAYPNLLFGLPRELPALLRLLRSEGVAAVEFHHGLGHHPVLRELGARLGVPVDQVVHDYASFCKRVNLIGAARRYCGEPDSASCAACVAREGSELTDPIDPIALRARSAAEFRAARRVTVPSGDAARRLARHFPGIRPEVTPWEDDDAALKLAPPSSGPRRIAVVGGIGPAKGYDVLLGCARDAAARRLPLRFVLIGASEHDAPLIETGVEVTGPYREGEATALIRRLRPDLGFLPSIWPETWCFALSECWRAGLYTLVFDLGAQAERVRATGRGGVLPIGLPCGRINDILLAWQPVFGDFNLQANIRNPVRRMPIHDLQS